MLVKDIRKGQVQDFKYEDQSLKIIKNEGNLTFIDLKSIQGIIIQSEDILTIRRILNAIRTNNAPMVYLMPIFLDSATFYKKLGAEVDGYIKNDFNAFTSEKIRDIYGLISKIKDVAGEIEDYNERIIFKSVQYLYTRSISLNPYTDRTSPIGYHLPFISSLSSEKEIYTFHKKLKEKVTKAYLQSTLIDRINLCNSCLSNYLNFHEVCSKCESIDLKHENLIHHFRCAYIGPESDFIDGASLSCPKCDKELKHIGIDFDKPSEIASCNHCNHSSQETKMKAKCVDCNTDNDLSQLSEMEIFNYEITNKGIEWVLGHIDITSQQENLDDRSIVSPAIFKFLIAQEKERIKLSPKIKSYHGQINIEEVAFRNLNLEFKSKLKQEILKILKSYVRPIDALSADDYSLFNILIVNINPREAKKLFLLIIENLNKILSDNLSNNERLVIGKLNLI